MAGDDWAWAKAEVTPRANTRSVVVIGDKRRSVGDYYAGEYLCVGEQEESRGWIERGEGKGRDLEGDEGKEMWMIKGEGKKEKHGMGCAFIYGGPCPANLLIDAQRLE